MTDSDSETVSEAYTPSKRQVSSKKSPQPQQKPSKKAIPEKALKGEKQKKPVKKEVRKTSKQKEPNEQKEQMEQKEQKEQKIQKGQKGPKQQKVQKVQKEQIEQKEPQSAGCDEKQLQTVYEYMFKQNRPYNMLNVFDNLHGTIKKPILEATLNQLSDQGKLTAKQFGKNKLYFVNQNSFSVSLTEIEAMTARMTELKQERQELQEQHKKVFEQLRKVSALKTKDELKSEVSCLQSNIGRLRAKRENLLDANAVKVEESIVIAVEKEGERLKKELLKRRRIVKQCLKTWAEILGKRVPQVAEEMGIDI